VPSVSFTDALRASQLKLWDEQSAADGHLEAGAA
jgi:hypothetical protein